MKILALLPPDARSTLERSLDPSRRLAKAGSADAAISAMHERKFDALVIDPAFLGADEFDAVLRVANDSAVKVLLYTPLSELGAQRIVKTAPQYIHELVLRGAEDSPEVLHHALSALAAPSVPAMLLNQSATRFREFPPQLQTVTIGLFGGGALPRWVEGLVKDSGFARRTVDRWMHRGGISGAARLLDTVRLARVWEPLVEQQRSLLDVATRCGYERVRLLTSHTRRILGVEPTKIRLVFSKQSFAARLADSLRG